MAGLGAFALAGAIGGAGNALIEQARQQREDALAALKRQQDEEDYQRRRADGLADYQMRRGDLLADEQRGIDRENERIDRTAGVLQRTRFSGNQTDFLKEIMPHAERVGAEIGVAPEIIVAQAALETGWGRSAPGNNFFGIKSHGKPGGNVLATNEVINGQTVRINDSFRTYDSIGASVEGYGEFLRQNPRYAEMLAARDIESQIDALGRSGYATDPNYTSKIRSIIGQVRNMDPEIFRTLADPNVPAAVKQQIEANLGLSGGQQRKTAKGADGFLRYLDTGERVFPDAEAAPKDEYGRYVAEMKAAGQEPLSRIDYAQAKEGAGVTVTGPDGTVMQVGGSSQQRLREQESKDLVYVTRAEGALDSVNEHGNALTSRWQRLAEWDPTGLARELQTDEFQLAKQAGDEYLQAILRKDTGAAITVPEQNLYGVTYLPQPGDGEAVLRQKAQARIRAVQAIKNGMNPAGLERLARSEQAGIYGDRVPQTSVFAPPADVAAGAAQANPAPALDFSTMSLEQLNALTEDTVMGLSAPQLTALQDRLNQLTAGGGSR